MNWVHSALLVKYYNQTDQVILEAFAPNSQWTLIKSEIFSRRRTFNFTDDVFPEIGFSLTLKRIPAYYIYNIIAPVLLLTLLSCLVYVLPADAGEKVGLQITILLSFSVMLLVMGDTTPKSGKTTPLISTSIQYMIQKCCAFKKWSIPRPREISGRNTDLRDLVHP